MDFTIAGFSNISLGKVGRVGGGGGGGIQLFQRAVIRDRNFSENCQKITILLHAMLNIL